MNKTKIINIVILPTAAVILCILAQVLSGERPPSVVECVLVSLCTQLVFREGV